jgi:hypothetical protein
MATTSIFRLTYKSYDVTDEFSNDHLIMSLSRNRKGSSVAECLSYCLNYPECFSITFTFSNFSSIHCKFLNETPLMTGSDIYVSKNSSIFISDTPRKGGYNCLSNECDQTKGLTCRNNRCVCNITNK